MANPPVTGKLAEVSVAGIRGENTMPRSFGIKNPTDPGLAIGVNGISHEVGVNGHGGRVGVRGDNSGSALGFLGGMDPIFQQEAGVYGQSAHQGVMGLSTDAGGTGVYGGSTTSGGGTGTGVRGETSSGTGVLGRSFGSGTGVFGTSEQGEGVHGESNSTQFSAVAGIEKNPSSGVAAVFGSNLGGGPGIFGTSEQGEGVHGETNSNVFAAVAGIAMNPSGTGAGIFGESRGKGPAGFFKGDVVVTGNLNMSSPTSDIVLGDVAEGFSTQDGKIIEPGTVVVLDQHGQVRPGDEAYDKKVAGVVSGAGNDRPAIVLDKQLSQAGRLPVALMGKVCCKVDAEYSPIEVGDLLTTSATPGHAMRATDPLRAFGSVIGKALHPLLGGKGTIPILIALQ